MKIVGTFIIEANASEAKALRSMLARSSCSSYDCTKVRADDKCDCERCIHQALLTGLPS